MNEKERMQVIQDYHECMARDRAELESHNKEILDEVRKVCTENVFKEIVEYLPGVEGAGKIKISDTPKGSFQDEGLEFIKGVYVDQSCAAWAEDAYYGTISIPIGNGKFLEIPYSC